MNGTFISTSAEKSNLNPKNRIDRKPEISYVMASIQATQADVDMQDKAIGVVAKFNKTTVLYFLKNQFLPEKSDSQNESIPLNQLPACSIAV